MAITTRPCCDELIEPDVPHGARHSGDIPLRQAWMIGQRSAAADERLSRGQPISDDGEQIQSWQAWLFVDRVRKAFPQSICGVFHKQKGHSGRGDGDSKCGSKQRKSMIQFKAFYEIECNWKMKQIHAVTNCPNEK